MRIQRVETLNLNNSKKQKTINPNFRRNWEEHISWGANYIKETGKTNFKLFSFPDAKAVFVEVASKAVANMGNIKDRLVQVFATAGAALTISNIESKDDSSKVYKMDSKGNGIYEANNIDAKIDDSYRYIIVDKNNNFNIVKDPYAKKQENIHGWSSIYNPDNYEWKNLDWLEGNDSRRIVRKPEEPLRGLENLIIEEVNIPTLTKEGNFESAQKRIDTIAERGIATAIEIMPVENTFSKQWGYDGVDKFAVNEKLGGAAKLKELIDYAHGKGLNVIMDMVPNHMGPDGDYLKQTGPYESGDGPFGAKLNYEGKDNRYVRDWMTNAALWWANEFKVDGIRFDMTKETASDYLLKQMVDELNEHNPLVFTIAEDGRNNKLSVTRYDDAKNTHGDDLDFIDMNIEYIHSRNWNSTPHAVGFDSEWDFPLMHSLKSAIIDVDQVDLNTIDNLISLSGPRIKYVMSHDEIGNNDGTRLIPKVVAQDLDLFSNMDGVDTAEKGQKAAQLSQKLVEIILTNEDIPSTEFAKLQSDYGSSVFYDKKTLKTAVQKALAKQRLAQGTIMTIPGPKMYFQGDDNAEIAHFKFFREFSGDRDARSKDPKIKDNIIKEKGYDTINDTALSDSIIGRFPPRGSFKDISNQMIKYNQDLAKLLEENPAIKSGDITQKYKEHDKSVHMHRLQKDDNDIVVFKNFADNLYKGNYSSLGFPKEGQWKEIFNSDSAKYGGGGNTNEGMIFSDASQNLNMAPNSIVILKKI